MFKRFPLAQFFVLFFILTPFLSGCAAPLLAPLVTVGGIAYTAIPGNLNVKKEVEEPFSASIHEVDTIVVNDPQTYEALKETGLFSEVKLIEYHPRIREEAAKVAEKYNSDAFVWYNDEPGGGRSGYMRMQYGKAEISIITADGKSAYDQTISIHQRTAMAGSTPSLSEVKEYIVIVFIKEVEEHLS